MATKTVPLWDVVKDDIDWTIRRSTSTSVKYLVCVPTNGEAYFQDNSGKKTAICKDEWCKSTWSYFVKGMPTLHFKNSWIGEFDTVSSKKIFDILSNHELLEMIGKGYLDCLGEMKGYAWILNSSEENIFKVFVNDVLDAYRNYGTLLEENKIDGNTKAMQIILSQSRILKKIEVKWSMDEVKDFIKALAESPYINNQGFGIYKNVNSFTSFYQDCSSKGLEQRFIPLEARDYPEWKNFITKQFYNGYNENLNAVYADHDYMLKMERQLFGYVPIVYPENLNGDINLLLMIEEMVDDYREGTRIFPQITTYEKTVNDNRYSEKYIFKVPSNMSEYMAGAYCLKNNCLFNSVNDIYDGTKSVVYVYDKNNSTTKPIGSILIDRINLKIISALSKNNAEMNCVKMNPINIWFTDNKMCFKARKRAKKPQLCLYQESN